MGASCGVNVIWVGASSQINFVLMRRDPVIRGAIAITNKGSEGVYEGKKNEI